MPKKLSRHCAGYKALTVGGCLRMPEVSTKHNKRIRGAYVLQKLLPKTLALKPPPCNRTKDRQREVQSINDWTNVKSRPRFKTDAKSKSLWRNKDWEETMV